MKTLKEALNACTVVGNSIKPPSQQLDRELYVELKKNLELIGGKWKGGKVGAFLFEQDPAELFRQICNGEKRNLKQEYQFFATPPELADKLVSLIQWDNYDSFNIKPRILEPSAGQGAIIEAILRVRPRAFVVTVELMDTNRAILKRRIPVENIYIQKTTHDFLDFAAKGYEYDVIIANPPFTKNQDIDHLRHMYDMLAPGGQMVCMTSKHWELSENKKETEFRNWLMDLDKCEVLDVDANAFKSSGTSIATNIVIIWK